ncbi:discoidin domain-containing protein [Paenibacillus sp. GCM10028914]|uniref:discoidin domain-containing protein n=1 Tax=Paenibacillus sp. GCM10028914 TaxID=3273416 RepID=UPI00360C6C8D
MVQKENSKIIWGWFMAFIALCWLLSTSTVSASETDTSSISEAADNIIEGYALSASALSTGGVPITNIVNNGGNYGSSTINKAIDGDPSTHWETGTPNSSTFTNTVTVTFDQVHTLSRIEYLVRQGADWKGFPFHYKLYSSLTDTGENFTLFKEDTYMSAIGTSIEFEFPQTDARRVRMEFIQAKEDWASIAEISFYQPDAFLDAFKQVFTDKTYSKLTPAYNNTSSIQNLINMAVGHPNESNCVPILNDALTLVNQPTAFDNKIYTAIQRGNINQEASRGQMDSRHTVVPTGYYVTPGETIRIYVNADYGGILPQLVLGQALTNGGNWASWIKVYDLVPGINIIKAPPLAVDDTDGSKIRPAAIYLQNQAYPNQQPYVPQIRLVGGTKFPMYVHGKTNINDFMSELTAYVNNVENNDLYFDYDAIVNSGQPPKFYNIMELVTDNTITTTSARAALEGLNEQFAAKGQTIADTAETWERFYRVMNEYSGYEANDTNPVHQTPNSMMMSRLFTKGAHAWAGGGITGYQAYDDLNNGPRTGGFAKELIQVAGPGGGWGEAHEWGHIYDNHAIEIAEITNNMYSLRMEREFDIPSRLVQENRWDTIRRFNEGEAVELSVFEQTAMHYQLEMKYGLNTLYPLVNRYLREESLKGTFAGLDKWQTMAVAMSNVIGVDVTPHYAHYGKSMDLPKVRDLVNGLPVLQDKTWLITDQSRTLGTFVNGDKPQITSVDRFDVGVQLTFGINEPQNTVLAYEIFRDGELLGITYGSTYVDTTAETNQVYEYEIIAYDGKAVASPKSDKYRLRGKTASIFAADWTFTASPSAQSAFPLTNAFDKNTGTFFESLKQSGNKTITIDMKKEFYIKGFSYVARPFDQWNEGMMNTFNFYVSQDGTNWTKVINNGTVSNPNARGNNYNNINLPVITKARYVKLESLSVLEGTALAIAELSITGSETLFDPNGTYKIISKSSGKAIGVQNGATGNGSQVKQFTYINNDSLHWNIVQNPNGTYKFVNKLNGKVADVNGNSTANGANIIVYADSGTANQQWILSSDVQGYYTITSQHSAKVMDVNANSMLDDANIIQYTPSGANNQQWSIVRVD